MRLFKKFVHTFEVTLEEHMDKLVMLHKSVHIAILWLIF